MTEEMAIYESRDVAVIRKPSEVLADAKEAAKALADVIAKKSKPVVINGETYLEFEDWQTVGRFYGVSVKVASTSFIQYGEVQGFEARAVVIRNSDGMEVSAAEAMCLNDEALWKSRPLFQLRSMAQTRASAKALRNVLAWVVVLAGYKPTPAEEMQGVPESGKKTPLQEPQKKTNDVPEQNSAKISIKDVGEQTETKDKKPMKNPLYHILSDSGVDYRTFDKNLAKLAQSEVGTGVLFDVTYDKTQWGVDVKTLSPVDPWPMG